MVIIMAIDKSFIFGKSKAQIEEENAKYKVWAFPHGEIQRERLEERLRELYPKEKSIANVLVPFLTCKELFEGDLKEYGDAGRAIDYILNVRKKYKFILPADGMPLMLALVVADWKLDPQLVEYPSAEEILATAADFRSRKRKK